MKSLGVAVGRRDHDTARAREAGQVRKTGAGAVNDGYAAGDRFEQRRPLGDAQIRSDQIELRLVALAAAVTDQEDEQKVVGLELLAEGAEHGLHVLRGRALL